MSNTSPAIRNGVFWYVQILSDFIPPDNVLVLTHCRLNRLPLTIYWISPISILGTSGYEI